MKRRNLEIGVKACAPRVANASKQVGHVQENAIEKIKTLEREHRYHQTIER
eukprot:CAMPEP_0196573140 /NCGR_PEP_ID=MMETSP1081-20130531/3091_1 /TAXON_ID=36882 /ORGANISM="Pyramimonas amylifera, Strain CCMP720" /LENGTH=50 /DNA_ID=CAMNT_0041890753 /DNA_START=176 /DNA_END=331 /DNA_ORIENTATION=-